MQEEDETLQAAQVLGGLKQPFLTRMQSIPLVNRTVTSISSAYTSTKNSSGVLKYSAESVENLSMIITKPVLSTLEPVLRPLDRFASNQLDKVFINLQKVEKKFPSLRPETESTPSLRVEHLLNPSDPDPHEQNYQHVELKEDSRWGIARLGDDTIKALRYCLSFLKYGIETMQHQLQILGKALIDASHGAATTLSVKQHSDGTVATTSGNIMALITKAKREILDTLRKIVDMLGKYSASYLPVDARQSVRSFILTLPTRLGSVRPAHENTIDQEAEKVVQLATESTKMLENIEQVISATISAAEYTLGRKETVDGDVNGYQRKVRYISGGSEMTLSPAEQANNGMEDVEMALI